MHPSAALCLPDTDQEISLRCEDDFDFLSAEFSELHAQSDATPFQHPVWLDAFYRRLVPARAASPAVLTGREADAGRLLFVLPLIRRRKSGLCLLEAADLGVSDYAVPLIRRGFEGGAALREAIRPCLPAHDLLRLRPVRQEHVSLWRQFLDARPHRLEFSAHATYLSESHDEWRSKAMDGSFMRDLDRKTRRLLRLEEPQLTVLTEPEAIRAAVHEIGRMRAGRFQVDLLQTDSMRGFYDELALRGKDAGLLRVYLLQGREGVIGYMFCVIHERRLHCLLVACDYERYGKYSPGLILFDRVIADWIEAGGEIFDFTIGDEPYKKEFGSNAAAMFELMQARTLPGLLGYGVNQFRRVMAHYREKRQVKRSWYPRKEEKRST